MMTSPGRARILERPTAHGLFVERRLYDAARAFIDQHGYPPTVRELTAAIGYASPSSTMTRLHSMRRRACVSFQDGQSRTLVLHRRP